MESNEQYKHASYWDERFETEESYEWCARWEQFSSLVLPKLKPEDRILHVGCGTSNLSSILYELGFSHITNVDFSHTLIERCSSSHPHMNWVCDDARHLDSLPDAVFDVVIEKATIEALTVDEKSPWSWSAVGLANVDAVFDAVYRKLVPGGTFISISFTQPHFRVPLILRGNRRWDCSVDRFGEGFHFFCYTMTKGRTPDLIALEPYLSVTRRHDDGNELHADSGDLQPDPDEFVALFDRYST